MLAASPGAVVGNGTGDRRGWWNQPCAAQAKACFLKTLGIAARYPTRRSSEHFWR